MQHRQSACCTRPVPRTASTLEPHLGAPHPHCQKIAVTFSAYQIKHALLYSANHKTCWQLPPIHKESSQSRKNPVTPKAALIHQPHYPDTFHPHRPYHLAIHQHPALPAHLHLPLPPPDPPAPPAHQTLLAGHPNLQSLACWVLC